MLQVVDTIQPILVARISCLVVLFKNKLLTELQHHLPKLALLYQKTVQEGHIFISIFKRHKTSKENRR